MQFRLVAVAALLLAPGVVYAGEGESADPFADDGDGEGATAEVKAPEAKAKPRAKASRRRRARRGPKPVGWAVPESKLRLEPPARPSGNLHFVNLASHESVKINIYNEDGSYNVDALRAVSHLLRCKRTDSERDMEPRLFTVLSHVYDQYGKPIEIVSGYRNQRKQTSYHFKGSAADIRVPGVEPKKLRNFVDSLDAGGMGVGLYPRSRFVHVDIRPMPSYRWIDYSKADPDNPDKRPPRGWNKKRRKLQS